MSIEITTAIIAGVSALAGVIISQAISITLSFLDKRHQKQILLRQKYEQLMFEFQDSLSYFLAVQGCKSIEEIQEHAYSHSAGRAVSLAHLYFPSLAPVMADYQMSLISYYGSVVSVFNPHVPATAGAQLQMADKDMEVIKSFHESKTKTLDILISNAGNYTKA